MAPLGPPMLMKIHPLVHFNREQRERVSGVIFDRADPLPSAVIRYARRSILVQPVFGMQASRSRSQFVSEPLHFAPDLVLPARRGQHTWKGRMVDRLIRPNG